MLRLKGTFRCFSTIPNSKHCQLLVIGGGCGGIGASSILGSQYKTIVLEPSSDHYYQPFFTLVGAGLKKLSDCRRNTKDVMPSNVNWLQDGVASFEPSQNYVVTKNGTKIAYDVLIVATGIHPDFTKIPGLVEALKTPFVCSNYTPQTVQKTLEALQNFKEGNAIFTFPATPIKCPGAPQKIAYLTDEFLRKAGKRSAAKIIYNTAGAVLFGVKKYASALEEVSRQKDITVNYQHNLLSVQSANKCAIFEKPDKSTVTVPYEMLHVTPPMFSLSEVARSSLADSTGFVEVDKKTLQHKRFNNVFAIGDCTNCLPKTAAAVAASLGVLVDNVRSFTAGETLQAKYNGYTSCPLTTGFNKCILAEFDGFTATPMETFPFNQAKERRSMYYLKRDVIPEIYWRLFLHGKWTGPSTLRRMMRFGSS